MPTRTSSLLLFLPFLLLALTACGNRLDTVTESDETGAYREFQVDPETGLKQGTLRDYTKDGVLIAEENYLDGKLQGERLIYSPTGKVVVRENYVADRFEGTYTSYDSLGNKSLEGEYIDGAMNGYWYGFYPNGQLKEQVMFKNNAEEGPFREWYGDGTPKASGQYAGGDEEQGTLHLYAEDGTLARILDCDRGRCNTVWTPDSTATPVAGPAMDLPAIN